MDREAISGCAKNLPQFTGTHERRSQVSQQLNLAVPPLWGEIETVRRRAGDFLRDGGLDHDTAYAMSMVACELSENATKYGAFGGEEEPALRVDITVDERSVIVEVRNPVAATDGVHLARLDQVIQWIRGYQDPFEAYVERLREVSGQSLDSNESGLGLVRIAYEGQAVLDFYVNDEDILAVSAMYRR